MPSFFPAIHPNELLYSAVARWRCLVNPPRRHSVPISLLCDESQSRSHFAIDFPTRIDRFTSNLPPCFEQSSNELIERHTLFPFSAPFLEPEDRSELLQNQKADRASGRWLRRPCAIVGITPRSVLKFCPHCAVEDQEKYGEPYWHREHQPGCVVVCHKHGDPLASSPISKIDAAKGQYIALKAIFSSTFRVDTETDYWAYQVAADVAWLSASNDSIPGALRLSEAVTYPFRTGSGLRIKTREIARALLALVGSRCLERLGAPLGEKSFSWLDHLVRQRLKLLPLQCYLLVCYLTGTSIRDALKKASSIAPLERGPWPCVNQHCGYVGRRIITRFKQSNLDRNKIIFRCLECLETYTRELPLASNPDGTFQYTLTARSRGWHRRILPLWADHDLSVTAIATQLAKSPAAVQKAAADLGLPSRSPLGFPACALKRVRPEVRTSKRKQWVELLENNPGWYSARAIAERPHLYKWLRQHEGVWLAKHMPATAPELLRSFPRAPSDWSKRDSETAARIHEIATKMRSAHLAKPSRITRQRLIEALGRRNLGGHKTRARLPITDATLSNEADTDIQFAQRRIEWTGANWRKLNRMPNYRDFVKLSGLYWSAKKYPEVAAMICEVVAKARASIPITDR